MQNLKYLLNRAHDFFFVADSSCSVKEPYHRHLHLSLIAVNWLIFSWYCFQVIFFLMNISPGIAPDEPWHVAVIRYAAETPGFFIYDSPRSYGFGPISTYQYLYHVLYAWFIPLRPDSTHILVYLRWLNFPLAVINFWLIYAVARTITESRILATIALWISSNILMWVFINGMVNYDNLTNIFASSTFLCFLRFMKNGKRFYLLGSVVAVCLGGLTKVSFLPFMAFFPVATIVLLVWRPQLREGLFRSYWSIRDKVCLAVACISVVLCGHFYLGNIIQYGHYIPACEKVLGEETCFKDPQHARDQALIEAYRDTERMGFTKFFVDYCRESLRGVFGIFGHRSLMKPAEHLSGYYLFLQIAVLLSIFAFFRWDHVKRVALIFILFYLSILAAQNYGNYLARGVFGIAIQGRYLFPILAPALALLVTVYLARLRPQWQLFCGFSIGIVFGLNSGYFYFMRAFTPEFLTKIYTY